MKLYKLFILICWFFAASVHAATWNSQSDFYWNVSNGKISVFPGQGVGNIWTKAETGSSALGATVARSRALALGGATAEAKALFTPGGIAKGLLNPTSAVITLVGAALINQALDQACLHLQDVAGVPATGIQPNSPGQWQQCNFAPQNTTMYSYNTANPNLWAATATVAADLFWADEHKKNIWVDYSSECWAGMYQHKFTYAVDGQLRMVVTEKTNCGGTWVVSSTNANVVNTKIGQVMVRSGWKPATEAEAETALKPVFDAWTQADFSYGKTGGQGDLQQVLDSVMKSGNSVDVESVSTSGPATSPAGDTTTTSSDGTTTTTHNQYNYNYDNSNKSQSVVTVTQTTVNNVTNNQGQTSTTTTTTDKTPAPDPCDVNPDRAGCVKIGSPEDAQQLPRQSVPITLTPVPFAAPTGCPAPHQFDVFGKSYSITYDGFCNMLGPVRLIFLAFGAALSIVIFMQGLRS